VRKERKMKGFTLVELLIVLLILGIFDWVGCAKVSASFGTVKKDNILLQREDCDQRY